jgi:peroxiredoxin Q/BCP
MMKLCRGGVLAGGLTLLATSCASSNAAHTPSAPLSAGTAAPDLEGVDQDGVTWRIKDQRGRPLLVFFYPKAGTPGCTKEACAFRDIWQSYESAGIRVIGVSHDTAQAQADFAREHGFKFPLISDVDGRWGTAFGVPLRLWKFYSRVSFLVGRDGLVAKTYLDVDPGVHAQKVLADAKSL